MVLYLTVQYLYDSLTIGLTHLTRLLYLIWYLGVGAPDSYLFRNRLKGQAIAIIIINRPGTNLSLSLNLRHTTPSHTKPLIIDTGKQIMFLSLYCSPSHDFITSVPSGRSWPLSVKDSNWYLCTSLTLSVWGNSF